MKIIFFVCTFIIIIFGFVVYSNSINGGFLWDDHHLVVNNAYIKNWSNIIKIFTKDIASGAAGKFLYGISKIFGVAKQSFAPFSISAQLRCATPLNQQVPREAGLCAIITDHCRW